MASGSSSVPLSRAETLVDEKFLDCVPELKADLEDKAVVTEVPTSEKFVADAAACDPPHIGPSRSVFRKYILLVVFCLAQFLDVVNNSAIMAAIPTIASQLHMASGEQVWVISATQLSFASFLLLSGRISDVYSAKWAFVIGIGMLGIISIGMGLVRNKIALFALRAISGMFASLTIPAALNLIVRVFPEPLEQSRAIAVFGASGTIGNILGLFIGAILVQYASWPWVFWFATIVAIPVALVSIKLIPSEDEVEFDGRTQSSKMKGLDLLGVSLLTAALILFIYALTTGSSSKWASAGVLVPMILAIFLFGGFFWYETIIPEENAALPPKTWFYPNFGVLLGTALLPYFWWTTLFLVFTTYWQDVFGWSAISAVERQLPISIAAFTMTFTGSLSRVVNPKWLILVGEGMTIVATVLLPFASRPNTYWPLVFPAFAIGSAGTMLTYTHTNIAIFRSTPSRMAGTIGAIFNSALQLGSAVGSAAVTSITTSVENRDGPQGYLQFTGKAASFWFLLAVVVVEAISVLVFYKPRRIEFIDEESENDVPLTPIDNRGEARDEKVAQVA